MTLFKKEFVAMTPKKAYQYSINTPEKVGQW